MVITDGNCVNRKTPGSTKFKRFPYDSLTYITYPMRNRNVDAERLLAKNMYKCIYVDDADMVWIGTGGNGLVTFDPLHKRFFHYNSLGNGTVTNQGFVIDLIPDGGRYLLLETDHDGINRFDKILGKFTYCTYDGLNAEGLNNKGLSYLLKDRGGFFGWEPAGEV